MSHWLQTFLGFFIPQVTSLFFFSVTTKLFNSPQLIHCACSSHGAMREEWQDFSHPASSICQWEFLYLSTGGNGQGKMLLTKHSTTNLCARITGVRKQEARKRGSERFDEVVQEVTPKANSTKCELCEFSMWLAQLPFWPFPLHSTSCLTI